MRRVLVILLAFFALSMAFASPAWAGGGHDRGRDNDRGRCDRDDDYDDDDDDDDDRCGDRGNGHGDHHKCGPCKCKCKGKHNRGKCKVRIKILHKPHRWHHGVILCLPVPGALNHLRVHCLDRFLGLCCDCPDEPPPPPTNTAPDVTITIAESVLEEYGVQGNNTVFTQLSSVIVDFDGSATDLEDGPLDADQIDWQSSTGTSAQNTTSFAATFPASGVGTKHTITASTQDSLGLQGTGTLEVFVVQDTKAPDVTFFFEGVAVTSISVDSADGNPVKVDFVVEATDDKDKNLLPADVKPPPGSFFAVGTTTVNAIAGDAAGNVTQAQLQVTVKSAVVGTGTLYAGNGFSSSSARKFALVRFTGVSESQSTVDVPEVTPDAVIPGIAAFDILSMAIDSRPLPGGGALRDDLYVTSGTDVLHYAGASALTAKTAPSRTFSGFMKPAGLHVDATGRLYVSDMAADTVHVFADVDALPASGDVTSQSTKLTVDTPSGVLYDGGSDTLFVCQATTPGAIVAVDQFTANPGKGPSRLLANSNLREPRNLALDPVSNRLYVAVPASGGQFARILAFPADAPTGTVAAELRLFTVSSVPSLDGFISIAYDPGNDTIYANSINRIFAYEAVGTLSADNDVAPTRRIETPDSGTLELPSALVLDVSR